MAIKEKSWEDYEYRGYFEHANRSDLIPVVRKAAKAANQRLLRMERAGLTNGVYARISGQLAQLGRRRFAESEGRLKNMGLQELRHEYVLLRDWLSAKTSTVQGKKNADISQYYTAKMRGFTGTLEDWIEASKTYFTEQYEALFSSDVLYTSIITGDIDIVQNIINGNEKRKDNQPDRGAALLRYVKESNRRKREKRG